MDNLRVTYSRKDTENWTDHTTLIMNANDSMSRV